MCLLQDRKYVSSLTYTEKLSSHVLSIIFQADHRKHPAHEKSVWSGQHNRENLYLHPHLLLIFRTWRTFTSTLLSRESAALLKNPPFFQTFSHIGKMTCKHLDTFMKGFAEKAYLPGTCGHPFMPPAKSNRLKQINKRCRCCQNYPFYPFTALRSSSNRVSASTRFYCKAVFFRLHLRNHLLTRHKKRFHLRYPRGFFFRRCTPFRVRLQFLLHSVRFLPSSSQEHSVTPPVSLPCEKVSP